MTWKKATRILERIANDRRKNFTMKEKQAIWKARRMLRFYLTEDGK